MKRITTASKLIDQLTKAGFPLSVILEMVRFYANRPIKEWGNPEQFRKGKA